MDDIELPTCAVGEEAQPAGDTYQCGPADEATTDAYYGDPVSPIGILPPVGIIGEPAFPDYPTLADTGAHVDVWLLPVALIFVLLGMGFRQFR